MGVLTKEDKNWVEDTIYRVLTKFYQNVMLPKFATKEDLEGFATKEDLQEQIFKSESRIGARIDKLAEVVTDVKTNHERRITKLEKKVGLASSPLVV